LDKEIILARFFSSITDTPTLISKFCQNTGTLILTFLYSKYKFDKEIISFLEKAKKFERN